MDDDSNLSDGGSEHGYRISHRGEAENSFYDQGSPFMQKHASHKTTSTPADGVDLPSPETIPVTIRGWPYGPQPLRKYHGWKYLALLIDVPMTFLPVIYLVIGGAALSLNGKPRSPFGDNVIEATKYGTTAFPIVFSAVAARLLRALALWKCEKGAKLGLLEQLMGSQSLAGAVERFFTLARYDVIGIFVPLLWILSPFGSQMTLRLLELRDSQIISNPQIHYFNHTSYGVNLLSSFYGASSLSSDLPALGSLMGANMLSPQAKSLVDTWNNVKIPQFDEISSPERDPNNAWIQVDENSNISWVSLSGIIINDLPVTGASTFPVESSYMTASCPESIRLPTDNLKDRLTSAGIELSISNASNPWITNKRWNSMFLDTLKTSTTTLPWATIAPQSLIFGSVIGNTDDNGELGEPSIIDIFNCTLTTARVEANITCNGTACKAAQVRRSEKDHTSPFMPLFNWASYLILLGFIPESLGLPHDVYPSPPDQYLLGSTAPLSLASKAFSAGGYSHVPGPVVAKRLTTLLNSAWQASLCPYGIAFGSAANITACSSDSNNDPTATTTARTVTTFPDAVYATNELHATILLLIAALLQLAAFATMGLSAVTRAPNVLGFVSSMTRDNPYVAGVVPAGGSTLDGVERARLLGDVRVRLVDARPGERVGRVVLMGVERRGGGGVGGLSRRRAYG